LGTPSVRVVEGEAPAACAGLPSPDAVFVGGGVQAVGLLDAAWSALRSGGRMVANAVTLQSQFRLHAAQQAKGGTLTRLTVERLDTLGPHQIFRPAIAIVQWTATKP